MTGPSNWRSLRTVMLVTIHVAAVAYVLRLVVAPSSTADALIWVPVAISVGVFLSWPIGRALAWAFAPVDPSWNPHCPRCRRREVRPLVKAGGGLFEPASGYRCASCWTTFRHDQEGRLIAQEPLGDEPFHSSGIAFLSDTATEDEIRFLDDEVKSSNPV